MTWIRPARDPRPRRSRFGYFSGKDRQIHRGSPRVLLVALPRRKREMGGQDNVRPRLCPRDGRRARIAMLNHRKKCRWSRPRAGSYRRRRRRKDRPDVSISRRQVSITRVMGVGWGRRSRLGTRLCRTECGSKRKCRRAERVCFSGCVLVNIRHVQATTWALQRVVPTGWTHRVGRQLKGSINEGANGATGGGRRRSNDGR